METFLAMLKVGGAKGFKIVLKWKLEVFSHTEGGMQKVPTL